MDEVQLSGGAQQQASVGGGAAQSGVGPRADRGARGKADGDSAVRELFSGEMRVERKRFFFDLRENPRGRFLRIMEEVGGRKDAVMIPATGLERFMNVLERTIQANLDAGPPPAAERQSE